MVMECDCAGDIIEWNAHLAKLSYEYGLPKIHKPEVPLPLTPRPIYHLSKHLSVLLSPLVGQSTSAVRTSAKFVWFISSESLERDEVLISFDVVSSSTKIPTDLGIDVACCRLRDDDTLPDRTNMTLESVVLLLDFYLKAA